MFEVFQADTPELRRKAFKLRYQVYCVERDFENPTKNPDGLERDQFDDHSIQGILIHRRTGITVGTVRLVMHRPGAEQGCLPIHAVCQDAVVHCRDFLPFETTCELSRFAISKQFRRRVTDDSGYKANSGGGASASRPWLPYITLGLIAVALQMGLANGVRNVCAIMEPSMLRLVARLGFYFEPIGPLVLYHGWRQPCYAPVKSLLDRVAAEHPVIWEIITDKGRILSPHHRDAADTLPRALRPINIGMSTLKQSTALGFMDVEERVP